MTIGVFSPGAMGAALGKAWARGGTRVVTTVAGRSRRTASLAAGLELVPGLDDVVALADILVLVGPPGRARQMADAVIRSCTEGAHRPLIAELNAIAPATVQHIAECFASIGCELIDGSISGGPPPAATPTRLYLSGAAAHRLASLQAPGLVARVIGPQVGAASAIKMCSGSVYKGFTALLLHALATAQVHDVTDIVLSDLEPTFGGLVADAPARLAEAAAKSDRYPDEMREIALTQRAAGLPACLFDAMAEAYEHIAGTRLASLSPEEAEDTSDLADVLAELSRRVA